MARSKLTPDTQRQIIDNLALGCTVVDACDSAGISKPTFYVWCNRGGAELERVENNSRAKIRQSEQPYIDFLDAVTHAQMEARRRATAAITRALAGTHSKTETTETFTETRLDKTGKPYQYQKTIHKYSTTENPPDWRAGIEYLKRRDPEHWSGNPDVQITINIELVTQVVKALEDAGLDPAATFNEMLAQLYAQRENAG